MQKSLTNVPFQMFHLLTFDSNNTKTEHRVMAITLFFKSKHFIFYNGFQLEDRFSLLIYYRLINLN